MSKPSLKKVISTEYGTLNNAGHQILVEGRFLEINPSGKAVDQVWLGLTRYELLISDIENDDKKAEGEATLTEENSQKGATEKPRRHAGYSLRLRKTLPMKLIRILVIDDRAKRMAVATSTNLITFYEMCKPKDEWGKWKHAAAKLHQKLNKYRRQSQGKTIETSVSSGNADISKYITYPFICRQICDRGVQTDPLPEPPSPTVIEKPLMITYLDELDPIVVQEYQVALDRVFFFYENEIIVLCETVRYAGCHRSNSSTCVRQRQSGCEPQKSTSCPSLWNPPLSIKTTASSKSQERHFARRKLKKQEADTVDQMLEYRHRQRRHPQIKGEWNTAFTWNWDDGSDETALDLEKLLGEVNGEYGPNLDEATPESTSEPCEHCGERKSEVVNPQETFKQGDSYFISHADVREFHAGEIAMQLTLRDRNLLWLLTQNDITKLALSTLPHSVQDTNCTVVQKMAAWSDRVSCLVATEVLDQPTYDNCMESLKLFIKAVCIIFKKNVTELPGLKSLKPQQWTTLKSAADKRKSLSRDKFHQATLHIQVSRLVSGMGLLRVQRKDIDFFWPKYHRVAEFCWVIRNFNSFMSVMRGLQFYSVYRLGVAWEYLQKSDPTLCQLYLTMCDKMLALTTNLRKFGPKPKRLPIKCATVPWFPALICRLVNETWHLQAVRIPEPKQRMTAIESQKVEEQPPVGVAPWLHEYADDLSADIIEDAIDQSTWQIFDSGSSSCGSADEEVDPLDAEAFANLPEPPRPVSEEMDSNKTVFGKLRSRVMDAINDDDKKTSRLDKALKITGIKREKLDAVQNRVTKLLPEALKPKPPPEPRELTLLEKLSGKTEVEPEPPKSVLDKVKGAVTGEDKIEEDPMPKLPKPVDKNIDQMFEELKAEEAAQPKDTVHIIANKKRTPKIVRFFGKFMKKDNKATKSMGGTAYQPTPADLALMSFPSQDAMDRGKLRYSQKQKAGPGSSRLNANDDTKTMARRKSLLASGVAFNDINNKFKSGNKNENAKGTSELLDKIVALGKPLSYSRRFCSVCLASACPYRGDPARYLLEVQLAADRYKYVHNPQADAFLTRRPVLSDYLLLDSFRQGLA